MAITALVLFSINIILTKVASSRMDLHVGFSLIPLQFLGPPRQVHFK
jgi:hypothetical protein